MLLSAHASSGRDPSGSHQHYWNDRYQERERLFGQRPNAFIRSEAARIPPESEVLELGAGEGRNLLFLAERYGHRVTAVDFAEVGLRTARALAGERGLAIETVQADVRSWDPGRDWDAVLVTFLQLLPQERVRLYQLMRRILRPGGWILAEWFRPEHLRAPYASIGPGRAERMVKMNELREHFPSHGIVRCSKTEAVLDEGPLLQGSAAVLQFVYRDPLHE